MLSGYNWNAPATPPGDVSQPFDFSPGGGGSFFGSFTLQVFPAASPTSSLSSASPVTKLTLTGSGFAPNETVNIYFGGFGLRPFVTASTDGAGDFTITALEPQAAYGPQDVYAVGKIGGKLGATSIFVTQALVISAPARLSMSMGATPGSYCVPRRLTATAALWATAR